jgi:dTDP-4-amino-4,6-dideoxygalactose transaminase
MPIELPELNEILHSGVLAYGKWGRKFEQMLSDYIGNPNIAVVNSFNSAILVTLTTLGIKAGDQVIASPMSCLASNQPFATLGINVVWADIDPELGTLCPSSVREKITPKTKAIFHNHYCGYPGYIDEINEIGHESEILVIDDAIEAFGSEYKGKRIGNTGADATVFSFQTVRIPNTIDGGAIAFKDKSLYEKAKRIRDFGIHRDTFRDQLGEISLKSDISEPGYGATLSDVNSYIGCVQLEEIDKLLDIQQNNALAWCEKLKEVEYASLKVIDKSFHSPNYWVFGLLTENKIPTILEFREKGFYASGVHLPNNNYSVFGKQDILLGIEEFYLKFVALPCGWWF